MSTDSSQRFVFENFAIRGELVHIRKSFADIAQLRDYPSPIYNLLGEMLLSNLFLASGLKSPAHVTVQMQQQGALRVIAAKCNEKLHVRALAQWDKEASDSLLTNEIQQGELVVTVQSEHSLEPYQSIVAIDNKTVAQAMSHYFSQSEQLLTQFWFAVDERGASGLLLQRLPQEGDAADDEAWETINHLTKTITEKELLTLDNAEILRRLYNEYDLRLFDSRPIEFKCSCDVDKMKQAIVTLGELEANKLLTQYKEITVTCEYCNKQHGFTPLEVAELFAGDASGTVH